MKRSRVRNKYLNTKSVMIRKLAINNVNMLLVLKYMKKIDTKVVTDNRTFCKTVQPFLSEKVTKHSKTNLLKVKKLFLVTTRLLKSSMITL